MKFFTNYEHKEYVDSGVGYIRCPRFWLALMIIEHCYLIYYFLNIVDNFILFMFILIENTYLNMIYIYLLYLFENVCYHAINN
jgi:hypothetical protein